MFLPSRTGIRHDRPGGTSRPRSARQFPGPAQRIRGCCRRASIGHFPIGASTMMSCGSVSLLAPVDPKLQGGPRIRRVSVFSAGAGLLQIRQPLERCPPRGLDAGHADAVVPLAEFGELRRHRGQFAQVWPAAWPDPARPRAEGPGSRKNSSVFTSPGTANCLPCEIGLPRNQGRNGPWPVFPGGSDPGSDLLQHALAAKLATVGLSMVKSGRARHRWHTL